MLAQELLTALLMLPVANLGAGNQSGPKMCDITVADILGPKVIMNKRAVAHSGVEASGATDRDANFSLLSYSFSLVHSNSNLESSNTGGAARFARTGVARALQRGAVWRVGAGQPGCVRGEAIGGAA